MSLLNQPISRRTMLQGTASIAGAGLIGLALKQTVFAHSHDATPAAGSYPQSTYTAKEYAFDGPVNLTAGFNEITLQNDGTMDHHGMLLKLHDGKSVADLATVKDLPGLFQVAGGVGGPGGTGPKQTATVILNLEAGNYVLVCIIPDADGVPHMAKGMALPITVAPAIGEVDAAPVEDASFELAEFAFPDFPKTVTAGPHVWKVTNAGAQLHELIINRIADGVTADQVLAMLAAPADPMAGMDMGTPGATAPAAAENAGPPFIGITGIAPMGPKETNWLKLDLAAGNYLALCFVPDSESGAPHFALGMAMPFTVA
jgi:hypothetical protein